MASTNSLKAETKERLKTLLAKYEKGLEDSNYKYAENKAGEIISAVKCIVLDCESTFSIEEEIKKIRDKETDDLVERNKKLG